MMNDTKPTNIEIWNLIAKRFFKGLREHLFNYIAVPVVGLVFFAFVLWAISRLPDPGAGERGVGARMLEEYKEQRGDTFTDQVAGISFPLYLGGLRRGEITDFESRQAGLGIGVGYGVQDVAADIYVYNLGLQKIPNTLQHPTIVKHFTEVLDDIYYFEGKGLYKSGVKISESVLPVGRANAAPRALSAYFSLKMGGRNSLSHVYLWVYRDHFIKIRFSYPKEREAEGYQILSKFLDEVGSLLGDSPALSVQAQKGPSTN